MYMHVHEDSTAVRAVHNTFKHPIINRKGEEVGEWGDVRNEVTEVRSIPSYMLSGTRNQLTSEERIIAELLRRKS